MASRLSLSLSFSPSPSSSPSLFLSSFLPLPFAPSLFLLHPYSPLYSAYSSSLSPSPLFLSLFVHPFFLSPLVPPQFPYFPFSSSPPLILYLPFPSSSPSLHTDPTPSLLPVPPSFPLSSLPPPCSPTPSTPSTSLECASTPSPHPLRPLLTKHYTSASRAERTAPPINQLTPHRHDTRAAELLARCSLHDTSPHTLLHIFSLPSTPRYRNISTYRSTQYISSIQPQHNQNSTALRTSRKCTTQPMSTRAHACTHIASANLTRENLPSIALTHNHKYCTTCPLAGTTALLPIVRRDSTTPSPHVARNSDHTTHARSPARCIATPHIPQHPITVILPEPYCVCEHKAHPPQTHIAQHTTHRASHPICHRRLTYPDSLLSTTI
ncbi:hypothetical protein C7M84_022310 [Penaeus vannamei]|uniref:Uncharacterized protein n=1 Tax=Penaeus vannamei TaxID=6689 RepID=A0A3R7QZ97_PENVA|nr:hypothetical protein C7M84_022310 [Penaeus vannamei]